MKHTQHAESWEHCTLSTAHWQYHPLSVHWEHHSLSSTHWEYDTFSACLEHHTVCRRNEMAREKMRPILFFIISRGECQNPRCQNICWNLSVCPKWQFELSPTHLSRPKTEDKPLGESNCIREDGKNENIRIERSLLIIPRPFVMWDEGISKTRSIKAILDA